MPVSVPSTRLPTQRLFLALLSPQSALAAVILPRLPPYPSPLVTLLRCREWWVGRALRWRWAGCCCRSTHSATPWAVYWRWTATLWQAAKDSSCLTFTALSCPLAVLLPRQRGLVRLRQMVPVSLCLFFGFLLGGEVELTRW